MRALLKRLKHAIAGYDFAPPIPPTPHFHTLITDLIPSAAIVGPQDQAVSPFTPYGDLPVALLFGVKMCFTLTPYTEVITGLRLRVGTYQRVNHCHLTLRIAGYEHRINCRDFRDNEYQWIHLPQPLAWSSGQPVEVCLFSPDSSDLQHIAIWASQPLPEFVTHIGRETLRLPQHAPRPKVSIVIPVYNKALYTYNCLLSVLREDAHIQREVIVIDNASSDETPDLLARLQGAVQVVHNQENNGFVGACRQGAALALGEFILFLNNDTQVRPGWLANMLKVMERNPLVGLTGSKLIYPDGMLQEAGGIIFSDASGCNYGRREDPTLPYFNFSRAVDYCSGASLMIRKSLWEQLGGFDLRYAPAYYEDTDLCFAARAAGYLVWYCHDSEVIHHEGITAGTDLNCGFKAYQNINREKFIAKWRNVLETQHYPPGTPFDQAIARLTHAG